MTSKAGACLAAHPSLDGDIPSRISVHTDSRPSKRALRVLLRSGGMLVAVVGLGLLGLQIRPASFPPFPQQQPTLASIALPAGLPAPVERFYRQTYGDQVPIITTAVISGRGTMRLGGITVPIRFRFAHEAGQSYRHDVDLAVFGLVVTQGYETFIDGHGWGKTPGGVDQGPGFDQGSNVSLWVEALTWFPAVLITDPRVRWEPVDDATALLSVPFGAAREVLVVRFDPESGTVQHIEAMKYKTATGKKTLWISSVWIDDGKPWIHFDVEDVRYNVAVHDYIRSE